MTSITWHGRTYTAHGVVDAMGHHIRVTAGGFIAYMTGEKADEKAVS